MGETGFNLALAQRELLHYNTKPKVFFQLLLIKNIHHPKDLCTFLESMMLPFAHAVPSTYSSVVNMIGPLKANSISS